MKDLNQHLMSAKESKILVAEYDNSNYAQINKNREDGKPDSKMYTIDLSILKDYLNMIEEKMENQGIQNKGVRVTMGKYPLKTDDPKINAKYLGYQTIFFSAVDLDGKELQNNLAKSDQELAAPEEIPNMNYMHITPPRQ